MPHPLHVFYVTCVTCPGVSSATPQSEVEFYAFYLLPAFVFAFLLM